jgi:DNA-binding IclR family transcriptional regulator
MSDDKKSFGAAQLRLLRVIEALSGHEVFGIRLKEVAQAVKAGDPTVLRDLNTLEEGGWAKQDETGKWRLGQKPVQICTNFTWGLTQAKQAVSETEQRYTRAPI